MRPHCSFCLILFASSVALARFDGASTTTTSTRPTRLDYTTHRRRDYYRSQFGSRSRRS